jgi:hypothetical protein
VPNVTAIDWKQADVYGQLRAKGGMSSRFRGSCRLYFLQFTQLASR